MSNDNTAAVASLFVREAPGQYRVAADPEVNSAALRTLALRLNQGAVYSSPQAVKEFLMLQLAALEHEVFAVMFLDSQHRLIAFEHMFRGTLTQTAVYPREVVKRALHYNSGALALAHNHPSGSPEPSRADEFITNNIKAACGLLDIRVVDHLIVTPGAVSSMAERGLI